ncbi:Smr/MutS family protein [Sphingomonas sp. SUN019]|uniref:Smr/MutS family protein n=1 Tax=Sphingomonas sp. SUN019 TaxID=2937788 RepID=UPI0021648D2B|nr:Smr/MutS family protein [Sphingomonas sp. SUN019]UVO49076.1 Smr/MutS family protein [Sphingomonas sp. SUN019]
MPGRRLDPEEAALWAKVRASVRPLHPVVAKRAAVVAPPVAIKPVNKPVVAVKGRVPPIAPPRAKPAPPTANTLDGSWDRQIVRGVVIPDSTLDLHGHTLRSAHAMLDAGLDRSIARGDRVLLLVTGKPPRAESERPHARGAIRAAIGDWLAASRHASAIAAVRHAHPRHGGQGALYIVLRRGRSA